MTGKARIELRPTLVGWAIWQYGLSTLVLCLTVVASCLLTERLFGRAETLHDWSAVITGLLLFLTLPPGFPLWMGAVAGFIAIGLGKMLFGGLGLNVFNPALVGRAFVQAAFPVAITTWIPASFEGRFSSFIPSTFTPPFTIPPETAAWAGLLVLLCGLYLAARKMLDWRIPASVLAGAAAAASLFHLLDPARYPDAAFMLFSGGLMLGAWFMATDMVGSPVTPLGVVIYGLLIGVVTVIIRLFGGLTEGVMYAILLGNAATPLIESHGGSDVRHPAGQRGHAPHRPAHPAEGVRGEKVMTLPTRASGFGPDVQYCMRRGR